MSSSSQESLFETETPAQEWEKEAASRALDELFGAAQRYRHSADYRALLEFIGHFHNYAPFNAMLVHIQLPGATFVATASRWKRDYRRQLKVGAQPLVILQPMGPVMFVFDLSDTQAEPNTQPMLPQIEAPFGVRRGSIGRELPLTIDNAKRDGISMARVPAGSQSAGSIQEAKPGRTLPVLVKTRSEQWDEVPLRYEMLCNAKHSDSTQYATLIHELAHLYCGHLGTPNAKWWPDRRGLSLEAAEFEAESVCFLVCRRAGLQTPSEDYLSGYLETNETVPSISLDCVLKTAHLIEQMGRERLPLRKEAPR